MAGWVDGKWEPPGSEKQAGWAGERSDPGASRTMASRRGRVSPETQVVASQQQRAIEAANAVGATVEEVQGAFDELDQYFSGAIDQLSVFSEAVREQVHATTEVSIADIQRVYNAIEDQQKKAGRGMKGFFHDAMADLNAAALKQGRTTMKRLEGMGKEEAAAYRKLLEIQANEASEQKQGVFKTLKNLMLEVDRETAKTAMKNPILNLFSGFQRLRGTVAGKPLDAAMKGLKKMGGKLKDWSGDIWSNLIKLGVKAFEKLRDLMSINVFKVAEEKLSELRSTLLAFPGAQQLLGNMRELRTVLAGLNQQYGSTVEMNARLRSEVEARTNGYITMQDNMRALNAVAAEGVRGAEQQADAMERVATFTRITGESEQDVAGMYATLRNELGMAEEQTYTTMTAFDEFTRRIAASGEEWGVSVGQLSNIYRQHSETIHEMREAGASMEEIQRALLTSAQLGQQAGGFAEEYVNFMMRAGTIDQPGVLQHLIGSPQEVQEMINSGDIAGFWEGIAANYENIMENFSPEQQRQVREQLAEYFGMTTQQLDRLLDEVDSADDIYSAASESQMDFADATERNAEAQREATTPAQKINAELEAMATNIEVGGWRFSDIIETVDLANEKFSGLMGTFEGINQGIDFAFGPLGQWVKPLAAMPTAIMAIGGAFGDFTEEELGEYGLIGQFMLGAREFKETFWDDRLKPMLEGMWQGIKDFFDPTKGEGGHSIFWEMINQGVIWVRGHLPDIIDAAVDVASELMLTLGYAFEQMEDAGLFTMIADALAEVLEKAAPLMTIAASTAAEIATTLVTALVGVLTDPDVRRELKTFMEEMVEALLVIIDEIAPLLLAVGVALVESMWTAFEMIGEAIWMGIAKTLPHEGYGPLQGVMEALFGSTWEEAELRDTLGESGMTMEQYEGFRRAQAGPLAMPGSQDLTASSMIENIRKAETGGGVSTSEAGAAGHYQMLPSTASEAYASMPGTISGFERGHQFTEEELSSMAPVNQRRLASSHLQGLYNRAVELGISSPWLAAAIAYNGGSGALNSIASAGGVVEWANSLLNSPAAWVASGGWGSESLTYALRNMYIMEHDTDSPPGDDDMLYQTYLGWPRKPRPSDFGWPAGQEVPYAASAVDTTGLAFRPPDAAAWNVGAATTDRWRATAREEPHEEMYDAPAGLRAHVGLTTQPAEWEHSRAREEGYAYDRFKTPAVALPGAARGGIVTDPTHLIAGEAGPEVIFPLDEWRLDQDRRQRESLEAMRREVDRLVEVLASVREAASGDPFAAGMGV